MTKTLFQGVDLRPLSLEILSHIENEIEIKINRINLNTLYEELIPMLQVYKTNSKQKKIPSPFYVKYTNLNFGA